MSSLKDLDTHLFAALNRLSADLTEDKMAAEVKRADAVVALADQVVKNADIKLKAAKLYATHGDTVLPHLPMIGKATE